MAEREGTRAGLVGRGRGLEWPSLALAAGVYGAFVVLTLEQAHLPSLVFAGLCATVVALHASMQHEFIHGHPTPWRRFNRALGFVPLSLWLPFESYRITHIVHHVDEHLTDPFDDPESYYWTPEGWARLGPFGRFFLRVHSTLAGRLVFGPAWTIAKFVVAEGRAVIKGDPVKRRIWFWHALGAVVVLAWLVGVCRINPWFYASCVVYPSASILLLRSFAEHRAETDVFERTALVENAPILGFLFLYNNLHAAHHERPLIPWYALPRWYRDNRDRLLAENGGLAYDGYGDVARRYLFTPHDVCIHPAQAPMSGREPALKKHPDLSTARRASATRRLAAAAMARFGRGIAKKASVRA